MGIFEKNFQLGVFHFPSHLLTCIIFQTHPILNPPYPQPTPSSTHPFLPLRLAPNFYSRVDTIFCGKSRPVNFSK